jgi:hypothetical protein
MRRITLGLACVGVMFLAGCLEGSMSLPPNFIRVGQTGAGGFVQRGISADGVVVGLRTEKNPMGGTLEFWTEALGNQMTGDHGYKALGREDIKSDTGVPGRLLRFSSDRRGTEFTYLVAVYVQGDDILIAEAGGKADLVEAKMADIRKSLLSVK